MIFQIGLNDDFHGFFHGCLGLMRTPGQKCLAAQRWPPQVIPVTLGREKKAICSRNLSKPTTIDRQEVEGPTQKVQNTGSVTVLSPALFKHQQYNHITDLNCTPPKINTTSHKERTIVQRQNLGFP